MVVTVTCHFVNVKFTQSVMLFISSPLDQGVSIHLHVKTQAQERVQACQHYGSWIIMTIVNTCRAICIMYNAILIINAAYGFITDTDVHALFVILRACCYEKFLQARWTREFAGGLG